MSRRKETYFKMMSFVHETLYGLLRDPYKALTKAGLEPGQRVLEIGCGPGFFTVPAAEIVEENGSVLALDVNPLAVEHVGAKIEQAGVQNAQVIQANAAATGLPDHDFDLVFVFGIAHPIGGMDEIWAEIHRLLKKDGALAVEGRTQPPSELFARVHRQGRIARYAKPGQAPPCPAGPLGQQAQTGQKDAVPGPSSQPQAIQTATDAGSVP
jgi:ubiquinone/menaquinone biosynthesis C-methylase UbiE